MKYLALILQGAALCRDAVRQSTFTRSFLKPLVNEQLQTLHYTLSPAETKKVLFYYPMYTILACAEMYLALKGRGLKENERKRLTLISAMATLCDDLIDEEHWTRAEIFSLLSANAQATVSKKAQLLLALNTELKKFWPLSHKYLQQLKIALEWQSKSGRQLDPAINFAELLTISREKNGHTSLMFATLLDENWTEAEKKFIYQSAIAGQLTNDAFDIYFDAQNNLSTYINRSASITDARNFFVEECTKLHQYVLETDNPLKYKLRCIYRMSCMHAFTLVAFDHLQKTENFYGKPMDWKQPVRKQMVTDMAFTSNRLKLLRYIVYLSKILPHKKSEQG